MLKLANTFQQQAQRSTGAKDSSPWKGTCLRECAAAYCDIAELMEVMGDREQAVELFKVTRRLAVLLWKLEWLRSYGGVQMKEVTNKCTKGLKRLDVKLSVWERIFDWLGGGM